MEYNKTGIDESSLVYLQAKEKMIDIFKIVKGFIDEIRKIQRKMMMVLRKL